MFSTMTATLDIQSSLIINNFTSSSPSDNLFMPYILIFADNAVNEELQSTSVCVDNTIVSNINNQVVCRILLLRFPIPIITTKIITIRSLALFHTPTSRLISELCTPYIDRLLR
jgi:hypothetical protein